MIDVFDGELDGVVEGEDPTLGDDVAFVVAFSVVVTAAAGAVVSLEDELLLLFREARVELMI